MNQLTVILAHQTVRSVVVRHAAYWERLGFPMLLISPTDSPCSHPDMESVQLGENSPGVYISKDRALQILEFIHQRNCDRYLIFEYDALCFSKSVLATPSSSQAIVSRQQTNRLNFLTSVLCGAPYFLLHSDLGKMIAIGKSRPDVTELGVWDRYMSALIHLASVDIEPLHGFIANSISAREYPQLKRAIQRGVRVIHGIKHAETLDLIIQEIADSSTIP